MAGEVTPPRIFRITPAKPFSDSLCRAARRGESWRRDADACAWHGHAGCKVAGCNRPVRFNGWFHRGTRTCDRQRRTGHPGRIRTDTHLWSRRAACGMSRRNRPYGCLDCSCRSGPIKAQIPGRSCGVRQRAFGRPRAGYRAALYISGISSTWSRESLAKARHITTSSQLSHVP